MKIEIWSDIVCPFCYIGKRKLERALSKFPHQNFIEIEWKSFQLNPDEKTNPSISTIENLAKNKGWSMTQANEAVSYVKNMAAQEGLVFNYDKTIVANTKNGHRLIHLAQQQGKGDQMKERLLQAYFTDGLNIDDANTLAALGKEVGLDEKAILEMLSSDQLYEDVEKDIYESRLIGVSGVPFFVFDRKFGISGAQPDEVFDQTLEKAWSEYSKENNPIIMNSADSGDSCDMEGNC